MKKHILLIALLFASLMTQAQVKIGDNPTTIGASSLLELESTDKALLITRVPSVDSVASPVNGMIVYDITMKCTRAYHDGLWTECLGTDTGGGTGGGAADYGDLETELRWKEIDGNNYRYFGITLDGDLYTWGSAVSYFTPAAYSPTRLQDGFEMHKYKEISVFTGDAGGTSIKLRALTTDGRVFVRGYRVGIRNGYVSDTYATIGEIVPPVGGAKWIDLDDGARDDFFVGLLDNGDCYLSAYRFITNDTGIPSGGFGLVADPVGASPTFKYTRIISTSSTHGGTDPLGRSIILEGNDGKYYACGYNSIATNTNWGNPAFPPGVEYKYNVSAQIATMGFPAGKTVKRLHPKTVLFTDGTAYFNGYFINNSNTGLLRLKLVGNPTPPSSNSNYDFYNDKWYEIEPPMGHGGIKDFDYADLELSSVVIFIMNDGTIFRTGLGRSGNQNSLAGNYETMYTHFYDGEYSQCPLFEGYDFQEVDVKNNGSRNSAYFLDSQGKAYAVSQWSFPDANVLLTDNSPIPLPLLDGDHDVLNDNPENIPD